MKFCRLFALVALVCLTAFKTVHADQVSVWSVDRGFDLSRLKAPAVSEFPGIPAPMPAASSNAESFSPVQLLTTLANKLRDIRYKRGGRQPSTGFDCSGFVRYVFRLGIGVELPRTSAAQFLSGHQVARAELRSGDLVFFRTSGKRVSHVGIYLDGGRFIHSPSSGKRVSVSSLSEPYWSRRFAGGRRAEVLAQHARGPAIASADLLTPGA